MSIQFIVFLETRKAPMLQIMVKSYLVTSYIFTIIGDLLMTKKCTEPSDYLYS